MASTCSATFTATLPITTSCTVTLDDPNDIHVSASIDEVTITKRFMYTIGPNPDGDSMNYGWTLIVSGGWSPFITGSFLFTPTTPSIEGGPNAVKSGQVRVTSILDRAAAVAASPTANEAPVDYTIRINTGT